MMQKSAKKSSVRTKASKIVIDFVRDRSGATAIEYGLIASLLFLAIIGSVRAVATTNNETYTEIEATIDAAIN